MPRESIAMTPLEMSSFVGAQKWVVLGTLDPDGSPWADVVASYIEDDRLVFGVQAGSRSDNNIERDPRVVCMTDQYPTYYEIKGVTAHGSAELVTDPSVFARLPEDPISQNSTKRRAYAIHLDDITSFDFTKIKAKV